MEGPQRKQLFERLQSRAAAAGVAEATSICQLLAGMAQQDTQVGAGGMPSGACPNAHRPCGALVPLARGPLLSALPPPRPTPSPPLGSRYAAGPHVAGRVGLPAVHPAEGERAPGGGGQPGRQAGPLQGRDWRVGRLRAPASWTCIPTMLVWPRALRLGSAFCVLRARPPPGLAVGRSSLPAGRLCRLSLHYRSETPVCGRSPGPAAAVVEVCATYDGLLGTGVTPCSHHAARVCIAHLDRATAVPAAVMLRALLAHIWHKPVSARHWDGSLAACWLLLVVCFCVRGSRSLCCIARGAAHAGLQHLASTLGDGEPLDVSALLPVWLSASQRALLLPHLEVQWQAGLHQSLASEQVFARRTLPAQRQWPPLLPAGRCQPNASGRRCCPPPQGTLRCQCAHAFTGPASPRPIKRPWAAPAGAHAGHHAADQPQCRPAQKVGPRLLALLLLGPSLSTTRTSAAWCESSASCCGRRPPYHFAAVGRSPVLAHRSASSARVPALLPSAVDSSGRARSRCADALLPTLAGWSVSGRCFKQRWRRQRPLPPPPPPPPSPQLLRCRRHRRAPTNSLPRVRRTVLSRTGPRWMPGCCCFARSSPRATSSCCWQVWRRCLRPLLPTLARSSCLQAALPLRAALAGTKGGARLCKPCCRLLPLRGGAAAGASSGSCRSSWRSWRSGRPSWLSASTTPSRRGSWPPGWWQTGARRCRRTLLVSPSAAGPPCAHRFVLGGMHRFIRGFAQAVAQTWAPAAPPRGLRGSPLHSDPPAATPAQLPVSPPSPDRHPTPCPATLMGMAHSAAP